MTNAIFDVAALQTPVLAILRGYDPTRTVDLCIHAWRQGVALIEVPLQDDSAIPSLKAAVEAGRRIGMPVGAGTVTSLERLNAAASLGAAFTVAPGYDRDVAAASRARGLLHLPGVATATDVQHAMADGHRWLKAFPATVLGTDWIGAMRGPFPDARFVATGGIGRGNAQSFLDAGADLVALGSSIESYDASWSLSSRHDLENGARR